MAIFEGYKQLITIKKCHKHFSIENNHVIKIKIRQLKGDYKKKYKI